MSAVSGFALDDPRPTYEELEDQLAERDALLHLAFVSICALQSERDRLKFQLDPDAKQVSAEFHRRLRKRGARAVLDAIYSGDPL